MEIIKLVLLLSFLRVWEFMFHLNEHFLPRKRCWPSLLVWYLELAHHPQETGLGSPCAGQCAPCTATYRRLQSPFVLSHGLCCFFFLRVCLQNFVVQKAKWGYNLSVTGNRGWLYESSTSHSYSHHNRIAAPHTTTRILHENLATLRLSLGWSPQARWWIFKKD